MALMKVPETWSSSLQKLTSQRNNYQSAIVIAKQASTCEPTKQQMANLNYQSANTDRNSLLPHGGSSSTGSGQLMISARKSAASLLRQKPSVQ